MTLKPILKFAHTLLEEALQPGDTAVDCTMGNGHDTLFLANLVGEAGHVFAFDIQQAALENTQNLLAQHGFVGRDDPAHRFTLIQNSHANLKDHIPAKVHQNIKAAIFNLGYLPGGDKTICTTPHSTMRAIETLIPMLATNGIIILVAYPGHPEGEHETVQILDYCKNLPRDTVNIIEYKILNNPNKPPLVIAIEKL